MNIDNQRDNKISAQGLIRRAQEYYIGYKIIQDKYPQFSQLFAVKYYLVCHSIELALKAFLIFNGYPEKELKSYKVGHDLEKILEIAYNQHGFILDIGCFEMIRTMNIAYKNKDFEYFASGYKILTEIERLGNLAHLIISKVTFDIRKRGNTSKAKE